MQADLYHLDAAFENGRKAAKARNRGDESTYLHWFRYTIRAATGSPLGKEITAEFDRGYRDVSA